MLKDLKGCLTALAVAALALGILCGGLTLYRSYETKTGFFRRATAQEIARAELSRKVRFYVGNGFLIMIATGFGLAALGGGLFIYNKAINERRLIYADDKTGLYPVVSENVAPLHLRAFGFRQDVERDFNKAIAPNRQITMTPRGALAVSGTLEEGVDVDAYERQAARVATTQTQIARAQAKRAAGTTMHDARLQAGYYNEEAGRMTALREKSEADAMLAQGRLIGRVGEEAPVEALPEMDAAAALNHAVTMYKQGVEEMPVGQAVDGRREPLLWTPYDTAVVAVVGANGTGKTSNAAAALVNGALLWRWHVVALAPEDKIADWYEYDDHVEAHVVDGRTFPYAINALTKEYRKRAAVMREHGVAHNQDLPVAVRFPKLAVVFEEFGSTYRNTCALLNRTMRTKLDALIADLFSLTRHADMYMIVIDQRPQRWPESMKGNVKLVIGYAMKMNQGQVVELYNLSKLPRRGAFYTDADNEGSVHSSWRMLSCASAVCKRVKRSTYGPVVVLPVRQANDDEPFANGHANGVPSGTNATNGTNDHPTPDDFTAKVGGVYERSRRSWDAVAVYYFDHCKRKKKTGTQAELRRVMATLEGKSPDAYKGEASDLFHTYAPDGDRSKSRRIERGNVYTLEDIRQYIEDDQRVDRVEALV